MKPNFREIVLLNIAVLVRSTWLLRAVLIRWNIKTSVETLLPQKYLVVGGVYFLPFHVPMIEALSAIKNRWGASYLVLGRQNFWAITAIQLWQAGKINILSKRLSGVLGTYTPETYFVYGKLLETQDKALMAGVYFLLSGLYTEKEAALVKSTKEWLSKMPEKQVVSLLPAAVKTKRAKLKFSSRVLYDLNELPLPSGFLIVKSV